MKRSEISSRQFLQNLFNGSIILSGLLALFYAMSFFEEASYLAYFNIPVSFASVSADTVFSFVAQYGIFFVSLLGIILFVYLMLSIYEEKTGDLELHWLYPSTLFIVSSCSIWLFDLFKSIWISIALTAGWSVILYKRNIYLGTIAILIILLHFFIIPKVTRPEIKEVQIVNIDTQDYLVVRIYSNRLIVKKYLEDDTMWNLRQRNEFMLKEIKNDYIFRNHSFN